ncbi:SpoIIE family protein phosphatase [Pirellulales bacterium]|jgi:serine phosphatase RsbU (regulator of sigma subunit)|nr:SpoIIE family protein phosphatase [Pirellulales bacterium]MDB4358437.1 SpoIIE family protein phosphatase [bacterium]
MTGGKAGERYRLVKEKTIIGRHPGCDIVVDSGSVSRQHAAIEMKDGGWCVEDLGSRNGTIVNGETLTGQHRLEASDEIGVCDDRLVFTVGDTTPSEWVSLGGETDESQAVFQSHDEESMIVSQLDIPGPSADEGMSQNAEAKLRAVNGLNRALGASLSLEDVLPRLLDGIFDIFPNVERGFVLLNDVKTNRLILRAKKLKNAEEKGSLQLSLSLVNKVASSQTAILSADATSDSRFRLNESVVDCNIRSVMCVPFISAEGVVLGVLQVDSRDIQNGFSEGDLEVLAGITGQAANAVEQATAHGEKVAQEQFKRDLELANRVQQGLLPSVPPEIEGFEVFDFYEAAHQVGGDYFSYIPLSENRLAVVLADVSGKGVSAALVMAALSADVRYTLAIESDVAKAVTLLNASFMRSGWDDRFATFVVVVLDSTSYAVSVVSAGHLPTYLRKSDGSVESVGFEEAGLPLGVDPTYVYEAAEVTVTAGCTLVLYTDGISEAMDHKNETYGLKRLEEVLSEPADSPAAVGQRLLVDVERHAAGQVRSDDMCLVCVGRPVVTE